MLSTKNHCDPKKQRDPKISAIQKAARSKKHHDQLYHKLSSAKKQHATPGPPKIALSTKKATLHINPITFN